MTAGPPPALLERYAALVREWAPRLDLVAPGDLDRLEERHIEDSLKALPWVERAPPGPCIDVGSGAGFPGIPLAIAVPSRAWRLLEPRRRRAAFLEEVVRELDLDCEVLPLRAEQAAQDRVLRGRHGLAIARALAEPRAAFALLEPLLVPRGLALVFAGRGADLPARARVTGEGLAIVRRDPEGPVEGDELEDS